jgi:hypothetical protein
MRFSLRWLFIAILLAALATTALLNANDYWAMAARSFLIYAMSFAVLGGIIRNGKARAFCIGFAVFGLMRYVASGLVVNSPFAPLLSDELIVRAHDAISSTSTEPVGEYATNPNFLVVHTYPEPEAFMWVARSIVIATVGVLGGFIAIWIQSRSRPVP